MKQEVKKIAAAIDKRIAGDVPVPKVEVKVDVADVAMLAAGAPPIPGKIDLTPTLAALWGWSLSSLPGRRHRKLLVRAIIEDHAYRKIQSKIKSVWKTKASEGAA
jgi:hypothetical protein